MGNNIKNKIFSWIFREKMKLFIIIIAIITNVIFGKIYREYWDMISICTFAISVGIIGICIWKEYKKEYKLSKLYLISINIIAMIHLFRSDGISFKAGFLLNMRSVFFFLLIILGGICVWIARRKFRKEFTIYLIISLWTVILNFGGFYHSLYSMYDSNGQEIFKIEQGMSWKQSVMPLDFIYYSADCFFGTDISDVRINYIDYMDLYDQDNVIHYHKDTYKNAERVMQLAKIASVFESILFLVYISIIILGIEEGKE